MADNSEFGQQFSYIEQQIGRLATYRDSHVAIIWASALDENLKLALLAKMQPLSRDIKDRIFDGYGPLSNFSAKIDVSYAIGLLPKEFYEVLRLFNKIRNKFAHATEVVHFQDKRISDLIDQIRHDESNVEDNKIILLNKLVEIETYLKFLINGEKRS